MAGRQETPEEQRKRNQREKRIADFQSWIYPAIHELQGLGNAYINTILQHISNTDLPLINIEVVEDSPWHSIARNTQVDTPVQFVLKENPAVNVEYLLSARELSAEEPPVRPAVVLQKADFATAFIDQSEDVKNAVKLSLLVYAEYLHTLSLLTTEEGIVEVIAHGHFAGSVADVYRHFAELLKAPVDDKKLEKLLPSEMRQADVGLDTVMQIATDALRQRGWNHYDRDRLMRFSRLGEPGYTAQEIVEEFIWIRALREASIIDRIKQGENDSPETRAVAFLEEWLAATV